METAHECVRVAKATKFRVGQHVRITKEKMRSAKAAKHNFSTLIFRFAKVTVRRPRLIYELVDLNGTPIDCQFYREELTPLRINGRTSYKINKIPDKRVRSGIREYLVRSRGYSQEFDSSEPAASMKFI